LRDVWIRPWVSDVAQDIRLAVRRLAADRRLTLAAIVALGLGMAATNTVFTIVNAMVLRGLPVPDPDRIVAFNDPNGMVLSASYLDVEDWRAGLRSLAGVGPYSGAGLTVADEGGSPEVFSGSYVSAGAFGLLGQPPALGREFVPEDDRPGAAPVVILGHRIWTTRYAGDPAILGRTIRVNDLPSVVVGVMPAGFRFPLVDELWLPLAQQPGLVRDARGRRSLRVFARLVDDVDLGQAQSELDALAARLARDHPDTNADFRPRLLPFTGTADHPIFVALFGSVAFVVLIACANVANLLLARSSERSRDVVVRLALGATRLRIVRQLLVESVVLAAVAGVVGLALSVLAVRAFSWAVSGISFAYWYHERWTMDGRVFGFVASVCLATAVLFGLVPAVQLARTDLNPALHARSRSVSGSRRWAGALLAAELTFTLASLAGAALMMRSFVAIYRADLVVDTSHLFAMWVQLPAQKYRTPEERARWYQRLEGRLEDVGPVAAASMASRVPFIGSPTWEVEIDGRPAPPGQGLPRASFVTIGPR
jgi:predicted permease